MKKKILFSLVFMLFICFPVQAELTDYLTPWYEDIRFSIGAGNDIIKTEGTNFEAYLIDGYNDMYNFNFKQEKEEKNKSMGVQITWPIVKHPVKIGIKSLVLNSVSSVGPYIEYDKNKLSFSIGYAENQYEYVEVSSDIVQPAFAGDPGMYINGTFYEPGTEVDASFSNPDMSTNSIKLGLGYDVTKNLKFIINYTKIKKKTVTPKVEYEIEGENITNLVQDNYEPAKVEIGGEDLIYCGFSYRFSAMWELATSWF